jgi:hypothetical protein
LTQGVAIGGTGAVMTPDMPARWRRGKSVPPPDDRAPDRGGRRAV